MVFFIVWLFFESSGSVLPFFFPGSMVFINQGHSTSCSKTCVDVATHEQNIICRQVMWLVLGQWKERKIYRMMNIRYFSAGSSWRSVLGKKCPRGFEYSRRPQVGGCTYTVGLKAHCFSHYKPTKEAKKVEILRFCTSKGGPFGNEADIRGALD